MFKVRFLILKDLVGSEKSVWFGVVGWFGVLECVL